MVSNATILEKLGEMAKAIHSIELALAARIPADALRLAHMDVQLLKQQMESVRETIADLKKQNEQAAAERKRLAENASSTGTKWSMAARVGMTALALISSLIGAAIVTLWK